MIRAFLRRRAPLIGIAGIAGACAHLSSPSPPPRTLEGLAEALGQASGTVVDSRDIAWEPSAGFWTETFRGRRVLFLGAAKAGEPRDVYRARVRLTLDGTPISVREVRNLTDTPLGDDSALAVRDQTAVFATVAYGRIQGVTVLDLAGVRGEDRPDGRFDRALLAITAFQETASVDGVGRTDLVLDVPARQAKLTLSPPELELDLGEKGRSLFYDLESRELRAREGGQAYAARAVPQHIQAKPLVLWAVDTVRAEVGPGPIAWLEDKVFGAKDAVKKNAYALFSASSKESQLRKDAAEVKAPSLDASQVDEAHAWPPPRIPSLWEEVKPGEGEWQAVTLPWLKQLKAPGGKKPPPYFYQTFIRPDSERPYSEVVLVAMDMRQLELGMQAGFEDPKPLTGPAGDGRLPRDKAVLDRVVGTFNGAFKTTHGKYGMMVDRRVLLPPVPGGATVVVDDEGKAGLGSWPKSEQVPEWIASYRQNLDPLVEDGVANPTGRYIWGWQLSGTSVMTQRTALCVTSGGHLFYAFGKEIDGPTLGKALRQAGCSYGMHLDMNPGHCGFVFTDIVSLKDKEFNLKILDNAMKIGPERFVRWSAKDFFYVMLRDPTPHDPSHVRWQADGGLQPAPEWLPGAYKGTLNIGTLTVELTSFEPGRFDFRIRAGTKEPSELGASPKKLELAGDDQHRVLASVGLGHTTDSTVYGLAFGEKASLELKTAYATLVVAASGAAIYAPGETVPLKAKSEAVQLPLLADDGQLLDAAGDHGALRLRGALCVTRAGRVLVARARHDSSGPIASALLRVGCQRVVELDRGSRHPAFVHRAGTETPPVAGYETTVIYALGRSMEARSFRWKAQGAGPSTTPTGYDYPIKKKAKLSHNP